VRLLLGCGVKRKPGLANAARPNNRQQTTSRIMQALGDVSQLAVTANKWR
jgi:hypothetical protein